MDTKGKGFWECGVQRPQYHLNVRHVQLYPRSCRVLSQQLFSPSFCVGLIGASLPPYSSDS